MSNIGIAIHGGAGTITREMMSPEKEKLYIEGLTESITESHKILKEGGSALDAVTKAVVILEDCPLFNAGKGSVFTNSATHEMDAALMDGSTLKAGAVASVTGVKNPILLAKMIMEKSEHVMLSGIGAADFAKLHKMEFEDAAYFYTQDRYDQLSRAKLIGGAYVDHSVFEQKKFGTVGAVALDSNGNLAAATSTGGMTNKLYGRIGDSPLIGCGTYANNSTCAISCTGDGEYFIRTVAAHTVHSLVEYLKLELSDAVKQIVHGTLRSIGGEGGIIAIDNKGNISMEFNSEGMYRASINSSEELNIQIYKS